MLTVKKYKSIPVEVEAVQWDGDVSKVKEISKFTGNENLTVEECNNCALLLPTPLGIIDVEKGDYIVKGKDGTCYPLSESSFLKCYELVSEESNSLAGTNDEEGIK